MDVRLTLLQALNALSPPVQTLYIGFSGGLDSTVLVQALAEILGEENLPYSAHLLHVHHGLSPYADAWAIHVQQLADKLRLPLTILRVDAKAKAGESPEAAARQARYDAFAKTIMPNSILMLAHHADDQAETLLLQLLRGAGVRGLAAMPQLTTFADARLMRPLLNITRKQLEVYAEEKQLSWIEDESNNNTDFDRNYLRHEIFPLLQARWPATVSCFTRSAEHSAQADNLLMEMAEQDLADLLDMDPHLNSLALRSLSPARLNNVLRYWLIKQDLPLPSTSKLQMLIQSLIYSRHDASPVVNWPGAEVRRFRNHLYAMKPLPALDPQWQTLWDVQEDLLLPAELGYLRASELQALAQGQPLGVRFRCGGEKLALVGRAGHHSLKNLMQEWDIPPWLRSRIPLLYREKELVAVVGYYP